MAPIRLYNSKTRRKEDFAPIDANNVRMYVCGPTVYDRAHIGNARPVVVFDVLFRLLRHVYGSDHVTYVRNFTDVDDKINAAALARQQAGDPRSLEALIAERTDETIAWYHADMDALGALRPSIKGEVTNRAEPRATAYIGPMVAMIETLIAGGHAYVKEGHALFRVRSYQDYGALSGRTVDDMIAGARVEVAPFKEDPMDFVLWKPSSDQEPGWASPWGRGRPGWHIECSAMSHELLGPSFDIHGGGLDLQFPHHENEIAQSACAHPGADFARVWMHNEMLQVEGKKMSKSLGNFFTVRDLLDQGVPGEVIRFVMLSTHYSKPMDWTKEKAEQAEATLRRWRRMFGEALEQEFAFEPANEVLEALANDLNTSEAITKLTDLYKQILKAANDILAQGGEYSGPDPSQLEARFVSSARLLGLLSPGMGSWALISASDFLKLERTLQSLRSAALSSKDFSGVDAMKRALLAAGVEVQMTKESVKLLPGPNFDASNLETVLESLK